MVLSKRGGQSNFPLMDRFKMLSQLSSQLCSKVATILPPVWTSLLGATYKVASTTLASAPCQSYIRFCRS